MTLYNICLIAMISLAVAMVIFMILWRAEIYTKTSGWCFVVSFILFMIMTFATAHFEWLEATHCPDCQMRVDTNYCPDCGTDMRAIIKRNE